jgi:hypothetical protein
MHNNFKTNIQTSSFNCYNDNNNNNNNKTTSSNHSYSTNDREFFIKKITFPKPLALKKIHLNWIPRKK